MLYTLSGMIAGGKTVSTVGYDGWGTSQPSRKRLVLRLGMHARLDNVLLPIHAAKNGHTASNSSGGKLSAIYLDAQTGDIWCHFAESLSGTVWPLSIRRVEAQTVPLNSKQAMTPLPDAIELLPHMTVQCEEGVFGKLEGVVVDVSKGRAVSLIVHVRSGQAFTHQNDPLAVLLEVAGQRLLVPYDWVIASSEALSPPLILTIAATTHQIARGCILRDDEFLEQEVYAIVVKNTALMPFVKHMRFTVVDGVVVIEGPGLSTRLRASLENDIWHVPGVLDIDNQSR